MTTNTSKKLSPVTETFHGYIETTRDSLLLFEACKRGILPRIKRRLQDKERHLIRSGTVFCFDEKESGVKRWTDGLVWSPSRILGNFLIYRELDDKKLARSCSADVNTAGLPIGVEEESPGAMRSRRNSSGYVVAPDLLRRQREKALVGSLKNSYRFKKHGLVKKSMSLLVDGVQQHIVSYYSKEDVLSGKLRTPSSFTELASLEVSPGFRLRENFRIPIFQQNHFEESADDGCMDTQQRQHRCNKNTTREYSVSSKPSVYETNSLSPENIMSTASSIDGSAATAQHQEQPIFVPVESASNHSRNSLYSLPPVTHHSSTSSSIRSCPTTTTITSEPDISQQLSSSLINGLPLNIFTAEDVQNQVSYHQSNHSDALLFQTENNKPHRKTNNQFITGTTFGVNGAKYGKVSHLLHNNNISSDENFRNCNRQARMNPTTELHHDHVLISSGGYHHSPFQNDDYHQGQNPHQHLFSSSSFHAINHASILPSRTNELITTNSFMADMNILLGTGWNDFELQL